MSGIVCLFEENTDIETDNLLGLATREPFSIGIKQCRLIVRVHDIKVDRIRSTQETPDRCCNINVPSPKLWIHSGRDIVVTTQQSACDPKPIVSGNPYFVRKGRPPPNCFQDP